jgi:hypothetical protein
MSFLRVFLSKKLLKSSFKTIHPSGQSMLEILLIINSRSVVYCGEAAGFFWFEREKVLFLDPVLFLVRVGEAAGI